MMGKVLDSGRCAADAPPGSRPTDGAASTGVSPPDGASIPNAANMVAADRARLLLALYDAKLQLEYLDSRWPTGTTPVTLARVEKALRDALPWAVIASAMSAGTAETPQAAQGQRPASATAEGRDAQTPTPKAVS